MFKFVKHKNEWYVSSESDVELPQIVNVNSSKGIKEKMLLEKVTLSGSRIDNNLKYYTFGNISNKEKLLKQLDELNVVFLDAFTDRFEDLSDIDWKKSKTKTKRLFNNLAKDISSLFIDQYIADNSNFDCPISRKSLLKSISKETHSLFYDYLKNCTDNIIFLESSQLSLLTDEKINNLIAESVDGKRFLSFLRDIKAYEINNLQTSGNSSKKTLAKKYPQKEVTSEGTFWYNERGDYHREDGPAIKWEDGDKEWFLNGQRHREDGPAIELANGDKEWYFNDQFHREDGPAVEQASGDKYWFLNGQLHRADGPAIEFANGAKYWYLNHKPHREDGPAFEGANGDKQWFLNGEELREEDFNLKISAKKYPKKEVNSNGTFWRNEKGEYHREDGPAIEYVNGEKSWYLNGQRHRADGPAVEYASGDKFWYLNGEHHREDGPAFELANGYKSWFLNGQLHREDGPAIEHANGDKSWYLNGQRHRADGPAVEWKNGRKEWYLNGLKLSEEEFKLKMNAKEYPKKEVTSAGTFWRNESGEYHRVDGPAIEWSSGAKEWWLNGKLHRVDGPAIERANGDKIWWLNGKYHRVDGPAIELANGNRLWFLNGAYHREDGPACEWANGNKEWHFNGKLHREGGPAVEGANGQKYWYLNGEQLSEEEFKLKTNAKEYPKKEVNSEGTFWRNEKGQLHREDGPAIEHVNGTKEWRLNDKLHREDGPAIEWANGTKDWFLNGKRHRADGPAVEYSNGNKYWWLNGKLHRVDGPAIEYANGQKSWFLNGEKLSEEEFTLKMNAKEYPKKEVTSEGTFWRNEKGELHREDGPAIVRANGDKQWWLNGEELSEEEFKLKMNAKKYLKKEVNSEGTCWRNEKGEYHRVDGPAIEWANGDKSWWLNGQRHREDGPAIEWSSGAKEWWLNGKRHREDGPAFEYSNGTKHWYLNGEELSEEEFTLKMNAKKYPKKEVNSNEIFWRNEKGEYHRVNGPACEYANGTKHWYLNGKLHRADGPAIEWANGDKHWWLNGELHREDGPACEFANGDKHWYLNGKRLSEDEFNLNMNVKEYSKKEITSEGTFLRNERSEYHRVDGPACEFANGTKHWYLNGQLHREDGPAVENVNGNRLWYLNGKCHREDGPACEYADGYKEWFLNGKRLSKEEFTSACKAKKPDACLANAQPEYYQSGTRIAIHQLKELIFSIISSQSPNAAKPFLTSTIGQSIIMLASGIYLSENSAFSTIAQELRVSAITNAGNALIEEVYNAVLPEIKVAIGQPEIKLIENNEEIFEEHPLTNLHMNQY